MQHHPGMTRSMCRVHSSHGSGLARAMLTVRCAPLPGAEEKFGRWLSTELLPKLPARKGLVAAHFLKAAEARGEQTTEQKIRGGDAAADWVVLVNGYSVGAVAALAAEELGESALAARGAAPDRVACVYELAFSMTATDLVRRS